MNSACAHVHDMHQGSVCLHIDSCGVIAYDLWGTRSLSLTLYLSLSLNLSIYTYKYTHICR